MLYKKKNPPKCACEAEAWQVCCQYYYCALYHFSSDLITFSSVLCNSFLLLVDHFPVSASIVPDSFYKVRCCEKDAQINFRKIYNLKLLFNLLINRRHVSGLLDFLVLLNFYILGTIIQPIMCLLLQQYQV